jgi:hypothetical protein
VGGGIGVEVAGGFSVCLGVEVTGVVGLFSALAGEDVEIVVVSVSSVETLSVGSICVLAGSAVLTILLAKTLSEENLNCENHLDKNGLSFSVVGTVTLSSAIPTLQQLDD